MSGSLFSPDEKKKLSPFFTNLDRTIFGLKLPQEVAGALFSRYSRTSKNLRRVFLDEFIGELGLSQREDDSDSKALEKARAFYDRVLVGYGDDSVAQLGGAHIACEEISNIAAKVIEDSRIGIAPLEKSTRYVRFDKKDPNGLYLYVREPRIMSSRFETAYVEGMDLLFATYAAQLNGITEFIRNRLPLSEMPFKHPKTGESLNYSEIQSDPELVRFAETAYRSTIRAQACDILRSYLPMATKTNVGLFGSGQAYEYLLTKLFSHPLQELQELGQGMHADLNCLIPSFVKRARKNTYMTETYEGTRAWVKLSLKDLGPTDSEAVTLVDYDPTAEERVLAAILYPHSRHSMERLRSEVRTWGPERRVEVLDEYLLRRRHRRDKPGRALEQVFYTFDLMGNIGMYRDLHRHRMLSQERQDFTVVHGYETPGEIKEAGFKEEFDSCMVRSADLYEALVGEFPYEAQYVVPFAYKIRWYMKMNLRELFHVAELRTMPQGHPDYRWMMQEVCRKVEAVHPALIRYARFIDWDEYRLGRLQSEMRTEYKKSIIDPPPSANTR